MADHLQRGDVRARFGVPVTEIPLDRGGRVAAGSAE
jgi:hypothetical protein